MTYTILVVTIPNQRVKSVLARHLAADPSVSLERAMVLLDQLPQRYARNLDKAAVARHIRDLQKLGVGFKVAEEESQEKPVEEEKPDDEKPLSASPRSIHFVSPMRLDDEPKRQRRGSAAPAPGPHRSRAQRALRAAGIIAVLIAAVWVLSMVGRKKFSISRTGPFLQSSQQSRHKRLHLVWEDEDSQETDSSISHVADSARYASDAWSDSACAAGEDVERVIRFYRIALSFNRRNANAWYGLISTYRQAGMLVEAIRAETEMKHEMGEDILSVQEIIAPYGSTDQYERGRDNTFRLKYYTKMRERDKLLEEVYLVARALRLECECHALSIYAATGEGAGMLVHVKANPFPLSVSDFQDRATVSYLE